MTLTLSGYDGVTITGLTLSMKSNSKKGAGSLTAKAGNTTFASISNSNFNTASWNGAWSQSYVDIKPTVTSCTVGEGENIVITISASVNSIYCESFTIDYETNEVETNEQLVQGLVDEYVKDGIYTKTTKINLDSSSNALKTELAEYKFEDLFHAKASNLERITYYNDNELLMTNKEGTYNSGYGTVTAKNLSAVQKVNSTAAIGDMTHFTHNGTTQVYDYIVKNTHENWNDPTDVGMEGFYVTPKDFSAAGYFTELYTGWTYDSVNNQYTLEVSNLDEIVSDFVNVVAPLLLDTVLTTNYIQVTSLVVKETTDGLVLQIIAAGDTGKLVGGTNILAEATITKECEKEFGYVDNSKIQFEFGENSDKSNVESSDAINSYEETVNGMTLTLTNMSKVYKDCYDKKGNSCIKLGTSSVVGSFEFTVPNEVNKVIIYVAGRQSKTVGINVNGKTQTITTLSDNGDYTAVEVDTSSNKTVTFATTSSGYRCMINAIEFCL